ncbi:PTS sugar transporter subunit IIC [Lactobacillus sp. PV034]|uniref:PTS sugar transporter subunit IIC n=1 Tax=Lactobacillus sp. PV034 TaxID=2594495 RepID=UPI00223FE60B|nr:PTS transporter subunit EIIC [Lactobacillus sp. PV034]QNQ80819.1 PTS sugar transporter subunit IIC [Lactobacillus sp. PV034]
MAKIVKWLETYILPLAAKLASVKWLVAMRDAFVTLLPVTMAGSLAILFNSMINVFKLQWGWNNLASILQPLMVVDNIVWNGTFALFAVYFAISWGYHLGRAFEVNRFVTSIVALIAFVMSITNIVKLKISTEDTVSLKHAIDVTQFSTSGLFTAILFGALGAGLFILLYKARITLKVQSNMPHAEWVAFSTLLPSIFSVFAVGIINYIFQRLTGTYFGNWLLTAIQGPIVKLGQGFGVVLLVTLLVQIFWFFGINGISVFTPVIDSLWLTPENSNVAAVHTGTHVPFIWVKDSFNVFVWFGGAGGTLALVIAILIFSKRADFRTIAKMALAPSIFNINEPVLFGLPVIFNPVYLIPFIVAPLINVSLAYWITKIGWVNPVQIFVPSIMPPIIGPYLACNYDWRAIVLSIVNIIIALLIWMPFVFAADKIASEDNPNRSFYMPQY